MVSKEVLTTVPEECKADEVLDEVFNAYHCWANKGGDEDPCEAEYCYCCEGLEVSKEALLQYVSEEVIEDMVQDMHIKLV